MLSLKALIIISNTQQKSQETDIKLQVLMDAMTTQQQSGPRPMPLESRTSTSQETISAQSQLQWHQSSQGRNGVIFKAFQIIRFTMKFVFNILSFFPFISWRFRFLWFPLRNGLQIRSRDVSADDDGAICCTNCTTSRSNCKYQAFMQGKLV